MTRKICLVSWAPFYAGAEVAALRLAVGLRKAGHEVLCVVGTEGELLSRLKEERFQTYHVPTRFTDKWKWWSYRTSRQELTRILRRERPDVVHSNDLPTHQMASDAAQRVGIPRVCHHRWIFEGQAIDWFNKFGAERHLFVSRALMDELCGNSPELAASDCEVVYDGLPLPELVSVGRTSQFGNESGDGLGSPSCQRKAARHELGLSPEKALVLFAGQIIERKGIGEVLRAWTTLQQRWRERAELVIVGDDLEGKGAYRRQMESLAVELGCGAKFMGFQKNVPTWLTAADMVLVPSHAEPLGNATLEAMAYARPVIGGDVGGIPEMVVGGETGLLIPPRDAPALAAAIERLLSDEGMRTTMGIAARRRCEALFSLEAHVEAVVRQYEMVFAKHATGELIA